MNAPNEFLAALAAGIDAERVAVGEPAGAPYTGTDWDNAAATVTAMNVLRAPFSERRTALMRMLRGFLDDGFFQLDGADN